jgi:4-methyl-5(b-hydroxyethyl)-thiazole monophosphate biosynthesis
MQALFFLTDGFEEIEALAPVDILRRGGVDVQTVSITGKQSVTGSHQITVLSDLLFSDLDASAIGNEATLILPGGPGWVSYKKHDGLLDLLRSQYKAGGRLAAICAAPAVLGVLGLLQGKKACCYPGLEAQLTGAEVINSPFVVDGSIITGRSAGASLMFGLALLEAIQGADAAARIKESLRL